MCSVHDVMMRMLISYLLSLSLSEIHELRYILSVSKVDHKAALDQEKR